MKIIEIRNGKFQGPAYNNPSNQLQRALGDYQTVWCGGVHGGTVRDAQGKCWDWWPTQEPLPGGFRKLKIVPAE